jgi:hypothetical protein
MNGIADGSIIATIITVHATTNLTTPTPSPSTPVRTAIHAAIAMKASTTGARRSEGLEWAVPVVVTVNCLQ